MTDIVSPFQEFIVTKAWVADGTVYREGWISTNDRDREREITEPEAFTNVIDDYFSRGAPVSNTHDIRSYPVGHLQKGALVRDGQIFKAATHPTDPADFTAFPSTGNGFYARLAINDPVAGHHVAKGNIGGCSFIAGVKKAEPLPNGGRRLLEFSHLLETTIAAYPINPKAVLTIAKAYGVQPDEVPMTPEEIQTLISTSIAKALENQKAPEPIAQKAEAAPALTIDDISKAIETKLADQFNRQGVGRAVPTNQPVADSREADPVAYIVKKAQSGDELDPTDKHLIAELTFAALTQGMELL